MRTCIIHMGLHKTASTSLQRMLCDNRDLLLSAGIYFPKTATGGLRSGHHKLAADMNERHIALNKAPVFRRLAREMYQHGSPPCVLLSSEDFSRNIHFPYFLARLQRWSERIGYRVELVAYVRPQHRAIQSMYTQRLKMLGLPGSFDDFVSQALRSIRYDYDRRFRLLLDSPGLSVRVHPFNAEILTEGIHRHFVRSLGIGEDHLRRLTFPEDKNVSPGAKTVAALFAIGQFLQAKRVEVTKFDVEWIGRFIRRVAKSRGWDKVRYNALTPELCAAIHAHFRESNERFAARVFVRRWDEVFAAELASVPPINIFRRENATAEEREEFDEFTHSAAEAIIRFRNKAGELQPAQ